MTTDPENTLVLETTRGRVVIALRPDLAPNHVERIKTLARQGFYDGVPFHRVIEDFMAQTGDPTGTGAGGPGYHFPDEPVRPGGTRPYRRGTVAMANLGPDTNGSQFFILLDDLSARQPPRYTIFGQVTAGEDALAAISSVPTRDERGGANSSPVEPVVLERVVIREG